jgi:hypothetical protein
MTKITRKPFTRGNKLVVTHVDGVFGQLKTQILNNGVTTDNMSHPNGHFYIDRQIMVLPGLTQQGYRFLAAENTEENDYGGYKYLPTTAHRGDEDGAEYLLAFTLPPHQENFALNAGRYSRLGTEKIHVLDSIAISFDQRDEGVVITNHTYLNGMDTDLATSYASDAYDLQLAIYNKEQDYKQSAPGTKKELTGQIFDTEIKGTNFIDGTYRLNPFLLTNINKEINPYITYLLSIKAPNIGKYVNKYTQYTRTKATAFMPFTSNDQSDGIEWTAVNDGEGGNDIEVRVKFGQQGDPNKPIFHTIGTYYINIYLGTDGDGLINSTIADVLAYVAAHDEITEIVTGKVNSGGDVNTVYFYGTLFLDDHIFVLAGGLTTEHVSDYQSGYAFLSFNVSLGFKTKLVPRDTVLTNNIQNCPTSHNGAADPFILPINETTTHSTLIRADDATEGVQTRIAVIDKTVQDKLRGGYNQWSEPPVKEHILDDACYDVVTVPMMELPGMSVNTLNIDRVPFLSWYGDNIVGTIADRRIIPISYPGTLHHVIALENHVFERGIVPSPYMINPDDPYFDATCVSSVGVGFTTGPLAPVSDYQQIAYTVWNAKNRLDMSKVIDRIYGPTWGQPDELSTTPCQYLHPVRMVGSDTVGRTKIGSGYGSYSTGTPIFVGQSNVNSWNRGLIGNAVMPGADVRYSNTNGTARWLEIRWIMSDGRHWNTHVVSGSPYGIVGLGGHTVFLYFKKHLSK